MPLSRYPYLLTKEMVNRKLFWYEEWQNICTKFDINIANMLMGEINPVYIMSLMKNEMELKFRRRAADSLNHSLYSELIFSGEFKFGSLDNNSISWLVKVRGELLYLNKYSYPKEIKKCSLCNVGEVEDVFHYVSVCPILKEYRMRFFGREALSRSEFIECLNGKDWGALVKYCRSSWKYRYELILEFNY